MVKSIFRTRVFGRKLFCFIVLVISLLGFMCSSVMADQLNWNIRSSGISKNLQGVCYGNGTFVAVGQSGKILTSIDGANWVDHSFSFNDLEGVCYGNGTFVAVGTGTILTSTDGVKWVNHSVTESLLAICYGNGTFMAVGGESEAGVILTSTDGANWSQSFTYSEPYQNETFRGVCYGNDTFLVAGDNGSYGLIFTSADCVNWSKVAVSPKNGYEGAEPPQVFGVTYTNGVFVFVGLVPDDFYSSTGYIFASSDGMNWSQQFRIDSNPLYEVAYGNGTFVVIGTRGRIVTSFDGARTWNSSSYVSGSQALRGICFGNDTFVAVGDRGEILQSGPNNTSPTTFSASGLVATSGGTQVAGTTLTFSCNSGGGNVPSATTTWANGSWSQSGFQVGSTYRVTPSKSGYSFTPAYLEFSGANSSLNFTAKNNTSNTSTISSITPMSVTTTVGTAPTLPTTVTATMSDGTTQNVAVTWGTIAPSLYANVGTFTVTGTIANSTVTATANITVNAAPAKISSITPVSVTTTAGTLPTLPSSVTATMSDGTTQNVAVTWAPVAPSLYANAGAFIVTGTVANSTVTATANVTVKAASVLVTGVSLNKTTLVINVGASETLTATISPTNATNKNVTWKSSNTAVATVDVNGMAVGVTAGTATITVTTADGSKTATCTVTVSNPGPANVPVTGVSLNKSSDTVTVGASDTLTAKITPTNATNKNVTWKSSNTTVATVDANGKVVGVSAGTATITVMTVDGSQTATCTVIVSVPNNTNIDLAPYAPEGWQAPLFVTKNKGQHYADTSLTSNDELYTNFCYINNGTESILKTTTIQTKIYVDDIEKLTADFQLQLDPGVYAYWIENQSIGKLSAGTHTIKMVIDSTNAISESNENNNQYSITVTIGSNNQPTSVSINKSSVSLIVGATEQLVATISPSNATDQTLTWSSSNPSIATVNVKGQITALSAGTTNIIATASNGVASFPCAVTVTSPQADVDLQPYKPDGWGAPLIVTKTRGQHYTDTSLTPNDELYLGYAMINNGFDSTPTATISFSFYADSYYIGSSKYTGLFGPGQWCWTNDPPNFFDMGKLSSGTHTIKMVIDSTNAIQETNEGNNEYSVTVNVGTVLSQLKITTSSLATGTVGSSYDVSLSAVGGSSPYTWSAIGLPVGLSINSSSGVITGTPTTSGNSTVTVTVQDSVGQSTSVNLSLNISFNSDVINYPNKSNISSDKTWTISFNGELDPSISLGDYVTITDSQNKIVAVVVAFGRDGKSITVSPPQGGYTSGEQYFLTIKKGLKSKTGTVMNKSEIMQFNIK